MSVEGLGNASPSTVWVAQSIGETRLDLSGAWRNDAEIDLRCGVGECCDRCSRPGGGRSRECEPLDRRYRRVGPTTTSPIGDDRSSDVDAERGRADRRGQIREVGSIWATRADRGQQFLEFQGFEQHRPAGPLQEFDGIDGVAVSGEEDDPLGMAPGDGLAWRRSYSVRPSIPGIRRSTRSASNSASRSSSSARPPSPAPTTSQSQVLGKRLRPTARSKIRRPPPVGAIPGWREFGGGRMPRSGPRRWSVPPPARRECER